MRQIMLDVACKRNKTIFLSSHNLDEVQRICNRIALIDRGEIKLYGQLILAFTVFLPKKISSSQTEELKFNWQK
jgi:ABC-type multidrug transport system ATPase subunit